MAVVNLRGTSGAGKSFIVRSIMERYDRKDPEFIEGRKQPIGYLLHRTCGHCTDGYNGYSDDPGFETANLVVCEHCHGSGHGRSLWVVGHYETACGGGDTISAGIETVYEQVRAAVANDYDVIYEGLIVQSDVRRCIELSQKHPGLVMVVALNTSFDECIASIQLRRDARGDTRPLNPTNTIKKGEEVLRQKLRFRDAGVDFRHLNRADAMLAVEQHLGWAAK